MTNEIIEILEKEFPEIAKKVPPENLLMRNPLVFNNRIEFSNGVIFRRHCEAGEFPVSYRFSVNDSKQLVIRPLTESQVVKTFGDGILYPKGTELASLRVPQKLKKKLRTIAIEIAWGHKEEARKLMNELIEES